MPVEHYRQEIPYLCSIDLKVTAQRIRLPSVTYVQRFLIHILWADANINFTQFGDDAALTNGILVEYNKENLVKDQEGKPIALKALTDFAAFSYDCRIDSDTQATQNRHFVCRHTFDKYMPIGLRVDSTNTLEVVVQDNLSASDNAHINMIFQGYNLGEKRRKRF